MSRQTGDMDAIRNFTASTIYTIYESVLYFVFALIMVFTVNVQLAVSMLCILPFTALTTFLRAEHLCAGKYQRQPGGESFREGRL